MNRRVVITGVGIVSPVGVTTDDSWSGMVEGRSGIREVPEWVAKEFPRGKLPATIAGVVPDFNPEQWLPSKKDASRADRFQQLAMAAAHQAWTSSGLPARLEGEAAERAASIVGVGYGGIGTILHQAEIMAAMGPGRVSAYSMPAALANLAPGNIAIRYNLRGSNWSPASACASGGHAIGEAFFHIRDERADVIVTGGAEAPLTPLVAGCFAATRALCTSYNDRPGQASRPFERKRDGFVLGEGAGILVLEELEHAKRRGANILAEVVGYGSTCDASHPTLPADGGEGAVRAMRQALSVAKLSPDQIGYVNAHGTSTQANDRIETAALKTVFGAHAKSGLMVSATKSMTGHLLGAAGGVEAAVSALALARGVLPPTINYDEPDPACDLDYVPNTARDVQVDAVMSNCFGFGGTNAVLVFRRFASA